MNRLYTALQLKQLYRLKELGFEYTDLTQIEMGVEDSEIFDLPDNLEALKEIVSGCTLCDLSKTRTKVVFGEGKKDADLMFVGEGPGATEDSTGRPFVGQAGRLLEEIIKDTLLISRTEYYIANIVKCRPPKNRVPTPGEALSCSPYLLKQIEIIKPKIIISLGGTAYRYLTQDTTPISRVRGSFLDMGDFLLMPTFHPSYLLRNRTKKRFVYDDLLKVKKLLEQISENKESMNLL
jgi:DNA polymerase